MATTYGFVVFKKWWPRSVLMGLAFPLAVLGNVLRMMTIVIAAEIGGQSWGNAAHENPVISMLPYVPAIFGLLWAGGLLERILKPARPGSTGGAAGTSRRTEPDRLEAEKQVV